jgi:hypothetical protein
VNLKGTYSGMRSGTGGGWNNHKAMWSGGKWKVS